MSTITKSQDSDKVDPKATAKLPYERPRLEKFGGIGDLTAALGLNGSDGLLGSSI